MLRQTHRGTVEAVTVGDAADLAGARLRLCQSRSRSSTFRTRSTLSGAHLTSLTSHPSTNATRRGEVAVRHQLLVVEGYPASNGLSTPTRNPAIPGGPTRAVPRAGIGHRRATSTVRLLAALQPAATDRAMPLLALIRQGVPPHGGFAIGSNAGCPFTEADNVRTLFPRDLHRLPP